ncbi:MAG TPA: AsmA family protein [Usitatibacter sp.]|nr:AsmA family protein [Usitatibacter sp.]
MSTWQKTALRIAAALAVLGVVAAIAIHLLVDPEKLKALAREKAQANWSRDIAIGSLDLGFFPVPWLEARDVSFSNPPWASERHLFQAQRITAHLALWPLVTGKVALRSLVVEGGQAVLEVSSDGEGNWRLPQAAQKPAAKAGSGRDSLLDLRRIEFDNLDIDDRRKPRSRHLWHVNKASLAMAPVMRDVHLEADVTRNGKPLKVEGKLDDFAHFGEAGAATQGSIAFDWGGAQLTLAGHLPLSPSLDGQRLHGELRAQALGDMLAFFDYKRQPRAPFEATFEATGDKGDIHLGNVAIRLGELQVRGDADVRLGSDKPAFELRLAAADVDWSRALRDAGGKVEKGVPEGEILPATPLGWGMLKGLANKKGFVEASIGRVKLGNGLQLADVKTHLDFDDGRLDVPRFTASMLGGTASVRLRMDSAGQRMHLDFEGKGLLLERWFHERGRKVPFEGGPMQIEARLDSHGESMKQLAANMDGPVQIRMGRGTYASQRAEAAEQKIAASFSTEQAPGIRFECVGAMLPFHSGRAQGALLAGAASDLSRLVTSGEIDFRRQQFELHGRLKPRSGSSISAVVGDVKLFGPMAKPQVSLDHPTVLARIGAAIATAGLSAAATAVADAATAKDADPCEAVFANRQYAERREDTHRGG